MEQPELSSSSHPSNSPNSNNSPTSPISLLDPILSPRPTSPANCHNIRYSPTSKLLNACLQRSQVSSQNIWHSPPSKLLNACLHRSQVSITKVRTITFPSCNPTNPYNSRCTPLSQCTSTYCASLPQILNTESWVLPTSGICALSPPTLRPTQAPQTPVLPQGCVPSTTQQ